MDIKSIIDSEDALPSRKPSVPIPARQDHLPSSAGYSNFYNPQTPVPEDRRDGRPPQPSPLQTPAYGDSKYSNVTPLNISTSPYQHAPPSSLSSTQYPLPQLSGQSPAHGHQTTQYLQREGHTAPAPSNSSFGCSTPSSQTPSASTPGSAHGHSGYPRPTSSHSIPTPNPAQQPLGYSKESPQQSYGQIRSLSQPQTGQQHMSQPGVPLGPPSTYARSSLNIRRGSPGIYEREQSLTRGSHGQLQNSTPLPTLAGSPPSYGARQSRSMSHDYPIKLEREQSLSVSPKTRLPSLPRIDSFGQPQYQPGSWSGQVTPSKRQAEADMPDGTREPSMNQTLSRAASTSVNGLLNATISSEVMKGVNRLSQPSDGSPERKTTPFDYIPRRQTPPTDNHINSPSVSSVPRSTMSPSAKADDLAATGDSPSLRTKKRTHKVISGDVEVKQSIDLENNRSFREDVITVAQPVKKKPRLGEPMGDSMPPSLSKPNAEKSQNATDLPSVTSKAKPRRWKEIPIWAQSIPGFPRQGRPANGNPRRQATGHSSNGIISTQSSGQVNAMQKINGHSHQINDVHVPVAQPDLANMGPLGPWEPSIANYIPSEELTKIISDWLFQHVVLREDVGVATAGGVAGQGAVLEIEAKIGQLIDKNTNDRLHLPVLNECVVSHSDPNLRIAFKSSMTEAQHRALNQYLNDALLSSQPPKAGAPRPPKPRIAMSYKHTKETDTFYELSQAGALQLPPSIAASLNINSRQANKAKVRITTDSTTGKEIAKIIKARVADIDVYSPNTAFDWRISVNVEMNYNGKKEDLVETEKRDGKHADRNKDRMSYKHLAYQIDLTQVTPADATSKTEKEHELEIEVASAEVRRQGLLAFNQQVSQYEDLIRGFVDNVRVLARHCKP